MKTDFPHMESVQGWLSREALLFTSYYASKFLSGSSFDALEIGVHHGKYFIGLENLTPKDGRCLAVDVFSMQDKNIDNSGLGALDTFTANVRKFATAAKRVVPREMDSLDIDVADFGKNRFGLISVDGGHTEKHTMADLRTAQDLMHPSGLVVLDDILNENWTGVVSGAVRFFGSDLATRLVPFAIGFNKLFCCHYSVHAKVLETVRGDREILAKSGIVPFKITEFAGHDIVSLKRK